MTLKTTFSENMEPGLRRLRSRNFISTFFLTKEVKVADADGQTEGQTVTIDIFFK